MFASGSGEDQEISDRGISLSDLRHSGTETHSSGAQPRSRTVDSNHLDQISSHMEEIYAHKRDMSDSYSYFGSDNYDIEGSQRSRENRILDNDDGDKDPLST